MLDCPKKAVSVRFYVNTFDIQSNLSVWLGGRLLEVVAYESLDHNGSKFSSLEYGNCCDLPYAPMLMQCFIHVKVNFEKKSGPSD